MFVVIDKFMDSANSGKPVSWLSPVHESLKKIKEIRITTNSVVLEYKDHTSFYDYSNPGYIAFAFWLALGHYRMNTTMIVDDETKDFIENTSSLLKIIIKLVMDGKTFVIGQCWFKSQFLEVLTVVYPEHENAIKSYIDQ